MVKNLMRKKQDVLWWVTACGLVWLSFCLRVYQLNNVAVDKGELMSITWFIRKGFVYLLTHNKDLNNHPLNSVLARLTSGGNESIFTLRWHSAVIGVLTVALLLHLARKWFGRRNSLVAGLLLATSAYHVSFSQISRGYVGLIAFTLFGFYFGLRAVETGQRRYWLAFGAASVLNIYNHLYGVMAVGVLALIIAGWLLERADISRLRLSKAWPALSPLLVSLLVVYLVGLALYLPMRADTLAIVGQNNQFRESDVRQAGGEAGLERISGPFVEAIRPFSLAQDDTRVRVADPEYHYTRLDGVARLAENRVGFYLSLISFGLGLIFCWRQFPRPALALVAWLAIPFAVQLIGSLVLPGAYFRGRFLGFIYPAYLLLASCGWPGLADWLATRTGRPAVRAVGWLGIGALVLLNLGWLNAYYAAARNEHWQDVADHVAQNAGERDVIMCGQRRKMACDADLSTRTGRDVAEITNLITFENVQANRLYLEQPGRVWLVMPRMPAWQVGQLQKAVEPGRYGLTGSPAYDQAGWILVDWQPTLGDNLAAALELGARLALNDEEKLRNHLSLTQLYLGRGQVAEAEKNFALAVELLPEDVPPDPELQAQLQYARQAAEPAAGLPSTAVPVDLNFAGKVRLLAYELSQPVLSPGDTLQVTLYWQPLSLIDQELVSFVHLTDQEATLLGQSTGVPGAGQFPTTTWQPGQVVVDTHPVQLATGTLAPLVATIQAGLFDPSGRQFIQAVNKQMQPIGSALADLKVTPAAWPTLDPAQPLDVNFANLIALKGYSLQLDPPAIVFYWQPLASMSEDYTVFIHLLDAEGRVIQQLDGPPRQGHYPTSWWAPGELITDLRQAPAVAPGRYRLLVGWYRLADGSRLPLADGSGDTVSLDAIEFP